MEDGVQVICSREINYREVFGRPRRREPGGGWRWRSSHRLVYLCRADLKSGFYSKWDSKRVISYEIGRDEVSEEISYAMVLESKLRRESLVRVFHVKWYKPICYRIHLSCKTRREYIGSLARRWTDFLFFLSFSEVRCICFPLHRSISVLTFVNSALSSVQQRSYFGLEENVG